MIVEDLIMKVLAGTISDTEKNQLEQLIQADEDLKDLYLYLNAGIQFPEEALLDSEQAYATHFVKMQLNNRQIQANEKTEELVFPMTEKKKLRNFYWVAASIIIIIISLVAYLFAPPAEKTKYHNTFATNKGSKSKLELPDGTNVWLNSETKLITTSDFRGKTREVILSGEAFFDVAKDSSRPFIIHTGQINIKVLGTAFNVKSYDQDETIETSLIHGKIEVTQNDRASEKVILLPNEKLIISKHHNNFKSETSSLPRVEVNKITKFNDSLVRETAWVMNKLVFTDQSLKEIVEVLERQFGLKIKITDEEVGKYTYHGIFEQESISEILDLLSLSKKFTYKIESTHITISK